MSLRYITEYNRLGVNLEETMERFMDSEEMYVRFLKKFLSDKNYDKYLKAAEAKNVEDAFEAMHALKGVTANLGLGKLYEEVRPMVEVYRSGKLDVDPDNLDRFIKYYAEAIEIIEGLEE